MQRFHHYVLLTLVLASLPSLLRLPLWVAAVAAIGAAIHYSGGWRKKITGKLVSGLLLMGVAGGIWLSFDSWFSGDSVLSFFIAVVFLKWSEADTRRDYLLLIFSSVILATVGALSYDNLLNMVHMVVVIFSLTLSLVAIHCDDALSSLAFILKKCTTLVVLGLPIMLLLFLTFPRIPGPLWDLGLAFGLPIKAMMDRGDGQFGKVKSLQPGGIQRSKEENENVLVAEFAGAVPFKSQLYWRGPVFWEYDGENWTLPEDWDNRGKLLGKAIKTRKRLEREIHHRKNLVHYTLRTMPNGGRWLYALDIPAQPGPEAFISDEYQLLSIRRIDDHEPKLELASYLDYQAGVELRQEQRERGLSWPEDQNPQLLELGQTLGTEMQSDRDILHRGLELLAAGDFQFDEAHVIQPGEHILDRYFFDEKRGGTEYLAGSFAMLMRAAGIPARLVSGFRGGTIIALTNFVIVKQSDAHAWVEVWLEGSGWNRVEPKDIVLPPDKKAAPAPEPEKEKATEVQVVNEKNQALAAKPAGDAKAKQPSKPAAKEKGGWQMVSLASLFGDMQKWVINYDPDRQIEMLRGMGIKESNWLNLMVTAATGVACLLGLYLSVAWWRGRKKLDQVSRSWQQFCRRLAKQGLAKEQHECPGNYLARITLEKPELKTATEDIIGRFIDIRYGGDSSARAATLFRRQVKRFISMT